MRDVEDDIVLTNSDEIVNALQDVETAVRDVERALESNSGSSSSWPWLIGMCLGVSLLYLPHLWFSNWRYALSYGVKTDKVIIQKLPRDCAFLAAPLGDKYCHYERVVSTVRWARSTTNQPIQSEDEGKTWTVFTPEAGEQVPTYSTVKMVSVSWQKVEE